ncbi:hypothetical protein EVAR_36073_1 [Eumeta japonica]|uniref:Uncharacterized protein n=1 Tax=Eumeta variegata TaxID=151549 RepID=A0A4C1YFQ1_EUMVA|nr:hypothetical protein EVAR_36073_1 [Eumeta japonica]
MLNSGRAVIWSTWLQHENGPVRYQSLRECRRKATASAMSFHPVSEFRWLTVPSITPHLPSSTHFPFYDFIALHQPISSPSVSPLSVCLSPLYQIFYSYPNAWKRTSNASEPASIHGHQ